MGVSSVVMRVYVRVGGMRVTVKEVRINHKHTYGANEEKEKE